MKSINKIMLSGNVGQEPEIKSTTSGVFVLKFSLAVQCSKKNKSSGETEKETDWHTITLYGKLAEIMQQYIKKGTRLYVEGVSRSTKYLSKDGQQKYYNFVIASDIVLLDSKKQSSEENKNAEPYKPYGNKVEAVQDDFTGDDDIPF